MQNSNSENELRALIENQMTAVRKKDVEGILPFYSEDIIQFDVVNPLQYKGSEVIKNRMQEWFSSFTGEIGIDAVELKIIANETLGFVHCLKHVNGNTKNGKLDMYWRETSCYEKIDGNWLITHQHSSVPFDKTNGKASLTLKP